MWAVLGKLALRTLTRTHLLGASWLVIDPVGPVAMVIAALLLAPG